MGPAADGWPGRYQRFVTRYPAPIVIGALAVGVAATVLAARLQLRTALVELLPSDDPGVVALARTQKRMGDLSLLLIGIHSPDYAANLRYAEALTGKLRALPPRVLSQASYDVADLRDFYRQNKWLFATEDDLESIRDRLRNEIGKRKNPLFVSLDAPEPMARLQQRLERSRGVDQRFPGGIFSNEDGRYVWIAALPPGGLFVEHAGEALFSAAQRLIEQDPPSRYHPAMRADLSGPIATSIATRKAVERDIAWVTCICLTVVALSIGLYFRRLRAIPLTGIPAALGTLLAFAVAELSFGYLSSSTAFLGTIIIGNGINHAIVLMSRYEEHRARGAGPERALASALEGVWRGTAVAALAASAAYASLTLTSFRGFYQFGVMGAVGSLCCWISTFTVLPALLVILDGRGRTARASLPRAPIELGWLARGLARRSAAVTATFTLLAIAALFGLRHFLKDPFEYDFRKLDARLDTSEDSKQLNRSADRLFGRWPSPTIVLADTVDEVLPIRETIRRQDHAFPGPDVIGQVVTVQDLLPGPPDVQRRKLALIAQIRKLTHDPALAVLTDDERAELSRVDPPPSLRELGPLDLPLLARRPFTEGDGSLGRVVLVYPPDAGISVWNGRDLLKIASVLQVLHLPDGRVIETSGSAVVFGAMIRSILHDAPIATLASLVAVLVIITFSIRPFSAAWLALGTLALGVLLMIGGAGWARVHVTFLNFIALPITFGVGAEYALNVISRCREERDAARAVVSTGAAVALCSWTTIVGYGSLLAARNQALQGFGRLAILGEVSCLSAAIVALPALLLWRQTRARSPQ